MFEEAKRLIFSWKEEKDSIALFFHQRKYAQAVGPVTHGAVRFKDALYCINGHTFDNDIIDESVLKYKPLNVKERIAFIETQPQHYHSFIQLNELFRELEKLCAKAEILESK